VTDRRRKINRKTRSTAPKPKLNGRAVHSDFEFDVYKVAKPLLPKGATLTYESETLPYVIQFSYRPDFVVEFDDGRKMYIETKGYLSASDRQKMISVKETNPELDIRILFQRNSPSCLGKGSKTRPTEWAQKHNFPCAVGEVPIEWFRNDND